MSDGWMNAPAPIMERPHVVILGAGASLAALPDGDKHGCRLPLMKDLVPMLRLEPILSKAGITYCGENFEDIYSTLTTGGEQPEVVAELEQAVSDYFAGLELPDRPTLYDHLVLSLREKDVIATFNWDPFLWQAMNRCAFRAPTLGPAASLYLHGNVAIGYCARHRPVTIGSRARPCRVCGGERSASRLFYPVGQKDYNQDACILGMWTDLRHELASAFLLTIFGYGAPKTDVEAVALMKSGWGKADQRRLEEVEIIDTRDDSDLSRTWDDFICGDHYDLHRTFYDSMVARYPRRSVEAMWAAMMDLTPQREQALPKDADWSELLDWYEPLLRQERSGPLRSETHK